MRLLESVIFRDLKPWIRFSFSFLRLGKLFCDSNKHGSDTSQNWPLLDPGPLFLGNYSQVPGCSRLSKDVSLSQGLTCRVRRKISQSQVHVLANAL